MSRPIGKATYTLNGGVLTFTKAGVYTLDYLPSGQVKIKLDGGTASVLSAAEFASITQFAFAPGAILSGPIAINGVSFTEAGPGGPFEINLNLNDLLGTLITQRGVAGTVDTLLINGSRADTLKVLWDYLDDAYVAGNNYYNVPLNEAFVRLGVEYTEYLAAGGAPLTDITAKFAADNGDADAIPQREQSMHDNLLGNIALVSIQGRNFGSPLEAQLLALVPDAYESRGVFSGDQSALGGAAHDSARAFDYDRGWARPDYLDTSFNGVVDTRAIDPATSGSMYYGSGNPSDDWNIVRHEGAQLELALKVKHRGGDEYAEGAIVGGVAQYNVLTGSQIGNPARAEWNFDFAATAFSPDQNFTYKLEFDLDPTAGENWVTLFSSAAPGDTDLGAGSTFQNSSNIAFYASLIDVDPNTAGIQPYTLGDGTFGVRLSAFDSGTGGLVATHKVEVIVGDGNPIGLP